MTPSRSPKAWLALLAAAGLLLARATEAQTPPTPLDPPGLPPVPSAPPPPPVDPDVPPTPAPPASTAPPPASTTPPPASTAPPPASTTPPVDPAPPATSAAPPVTPAPPVTSPFPTTPTPPPATTARPTPTAPANTARPAATPAARPAPPPPTPAPPSASPPADQKPDDDDGDGLFGPFRIGPIVGVGVPNLVSFGGQMKLTRYLGLGVNVGVIPTVQLSLYGEAQISYQEYDAYAHIYPFGGGFFVGAGVGYATMKGMFSQTADVPSTSPPQQVSASVEASVRSLILTPQLGYFYTTRPGFSIGIDVGAQVPLAPSQTDLTLTLPPGIDPSVAQPTVDEVESTLQKIGKQVVPTINLKIGWLL